MQGSDLRTSGVGKAPVASVWSAHGGAGASVVALALADTAAAHHMDVALVDLGDPARSGLAGVCTQEGRTLDREPGRDAIREGHRDGVAVRRLAPDLTGGLQAIRHPSACEWLATLAPAVDLIVVDTAATPSVTDERTNILTTWLDVSAPILVARPSIPSFQLCEGALAAIERRQSGGPIHLVLSGASPWPAQLVASAGRRTSQLLTETNAFPRDPELEWRGCTTDPLPENVRHAAARLLARIIPGFSVPLPLITGQPGRFRTPFHRRPGRG